MKVSGMTHVLYILYIYIHVFNHARRARLRKIVRPGIFRVASLSQHALRSAAMRKNDLDGQHLCCFAGKSCFC